MPPAPPPSVSRADWATEGGSQRWVPSLAPPLSPTLEDAEAERCGHMQIIHLPRFLCSRALGGVEEGLRREEINPEEKDVVVRKDIGEGALHSSVEMGCRADARIQASMLPQ